MKNRLHMMLLVAVPVILCLAVLLVALVDTSAYRTASANFDWDAWQKQLSDVTAAVGRDMGRYGQCEARREHDPSNPLTGGLTPAWRSCMVGSLRATETAAGAMAMVEIATVWLASHQGDTEMRSAALESVGRARLELARSMAGYRAFQKLTAAHDESVLLRAFQGNYSGQMLITDATADQVDRLEFSVILPEVALKQAAWRMRALGVGPG